jgi:hypothetical protein
MAPMGPSENMNRYLEHMLGHNSTQEAFQKLAFGYSESPLRAPQDSANDAFDAGFEQILEQKHYVCGRGCEASFACPERNNLKY